MLRRLGSSDSRFKTVNFVPGLNVLVAEKTQLSTDKDSRNGAGKSSLVELLHFLLGSRVDKTSLTSMPEFRDTTFELSLAWPEISDYLTVRRSPRAASDVVVEPDILEKGLFEELRTPRSITLATWQQLIESALFSLPAEHDGISGRAMLSLYMRRIRSHAFNDAIKTHPQQSLAEASANVAYLLGLDWKLAAQYKELAARESTRRKLSEASKDPVWGRIVGRSGELRGQISNTQQRVSALENQVARFNVVPHYERLQDEADDLDQRIRRLRAQDVADRQNLRDFTESIESEREPDMAYLEKTYANLGIVLSDAVSRRFEEVQAFHESVIANRRTYLQEEIDATNERLRERTEEREHLGADLAGVLERLNSGGALASLTSLQQQLATERSNLESLRNRFAAAEALESSRAEIRAERGRLETQVRRDIGERDQQVNAISILFLQFAQELYGDRSAYLEFDPTQTHLRIGPYIGSESSQGIGKMVTFCFDLTVAVIAHRGGRGPDFLVHDSHLFDGVDERQVARALMLARSVCLEEGIQYVATLNSDDLERVVALGAHIEDSVIEPRLTDAIENGGLFGFHFG